MILTNGGQRQENRGEEHGSRCFGLHAFTRMLIRSRVQSHAYLRYAEQRTPTRWWGVAHRFDQCSCSLLFWFGSVWYLLTSARAANILIIKTISSQFLQSLPIFRIHAAHAAVDLRWRMLWTTNQRTARCPLNWCGKGRAHHGLIDYNCRSFIMRFCSFFDPTVGSGLKTWSSKLELDGLECTGTRPDYLVNRDEQKNPPTIRDVFCA